MFYLGLWKPWINLDDKVQEHENNKNDEGDQAGPGFPCRIQHVLQLIRCPRECELGRVHILGQAVDVGVARTDTLLDLQRHLADRTNLAPKDLELGVVFPLEHSFLLEAVKVAPCWINPPSFAHLCLLLVCVFVISFFFFFFFF